MNEEDIKKLWTGQPTESTTLTTEQLRSRAKKFQRKIKLRNCVEYVAGVIVIFAFARYVAIFPYVLIQLGSVMIIIAAIFVLYQLHRRASARSLPAEFYGRPHLEFMRGELARQRDALNSVWFWYLAPLVPGMIVFRWGVESEAALSPHFATGWVVNITMGAVFIGVGFLNRFSAKRLQKEIDELDDFKEL